MKINFYNITTIAAIIITINACSPIKQIPQNNSTQFNTTQAQLISKNEALMAIKNLEAFKLKTKFEEDQNLFYPGLQEPKLLKTANALLNAAADDFIKVCKSGDISTTAFQNKIEMGLDRFKVLHLNSMDKERLCAYYKKLMDMVGLKSSAGHLNQFKSNSNF